MSRFIKITLTVLSSILLIGIIGYFIFIYEKPVDQKALNEFLSGQPIIDVHIHITKGYENNDEYSHFDQNIDTAKLEWTLSEFKKNNIVLALAGGPAHHALNWAKRSEKFWAGVIFPCSELVEQDEPCIQEFYNETELRELYENGLLMSMGESMYNYYGVPPTDPRLKPYWKIAAEKGLPVGIHADTGPPNVDENERPNYSPKYANPELLKPILKNYPNLKIYLMHYGGKYSDEAIDLMKEYSQIYCEMSAVSLFAPKFFWEPKIKRLFDEGLGNRLMFASDYTGTIRENIEIIYKIDWLTDKQKRDILYNNAANFLNLSDSVRKKHFDLVSKSAN